MSRWIATRPALSIVLGIVLTAVQGCALRSPTARPGASDNPWKTIKVNGRLTAVQGTFTQGDLEAIAAAVAIETAGQDGPHRALRSIQRHAAGEFPLFLLLDKTGGEVVEVMAGTWCGVLCGEGHWYAVQKIDGRWVVVGSGFWQS